MTTLAARRTLLTQLRDLDAVLAVAVKNCGTGPGGFQPGNTCAAATRRNSAGGSKRRRKAGKRRRNRGPSTGVGARTRATRRQKRGAQRQAQREWELRSEKPHASDDHRELADSHLSARNDLADTLRAERADLHETIRGNRTELAHSIRTERRDSDGERRTDRGLMKRRHRRETEGLAAAHARQITRLDAHQANQLARSKHPERLAERQQAERERIAEQHREGLADLRETHGTERAGLRQEQRDARESEREQWRSEIESRNDEDRSERFDQHRDHRGQIHELRQEQRRERLEYEREVRREERSERGKAYVDVKATPSDGVPEAQAILDAVLAEMGHAEAWADDSLDGMTRLKVLHEVRMAGRAWFRTEAQAVLDDVLGLEEKALFGAAKAKVGAFFGRAGKYVREIVAAGLLAVAGPGPVLQQEAIADPYRQQVEIQAEYLADFRKQIMAEDKPLDGTFTSRAEMYGNAAWSGAQSIVRSALVQGGVFDYEMREHFGRDRPCKTCREQVKLGWQPVGTLKAIGESECMSGCHCSYLFKKGLKGEPHVAGRGPLWEAAFGRTG